uniref:Uncharacterized protein n=1 Tax=Sphaerodactylus townsendi TaxID=933632 RepID=A0ACB8F382_9SAUR
MHSRAYLLLEREFQEYKNAGIFGISVTPLEDNFMEWAAEIQGLKDSLWEGAVLQLVMKYTENYNKVPPSINFTTIPFHPNVDPATGRPCVDFLDDPSKWNMKLTMSSILLIIQVMLSNPVLDNAVNTEAAKILKNNISLYRKRVIKCVTASQRLEAVAVTEQQPTTSIKFYVAPEESTPQQPRTLTVVVAVSALAVMEQGELGDVGVVLSKHLLDHIHLATDTCPSGLPRLHGLLQLLVLVPADQGARRAKRPHRQTIQRWFTLACAPCTSQYWVYPQSKEWFLEQPPASSDENHAAKSAICAP